MGSNIHCTYISEKINKIRWRPDSLSDPHSFVTGSWDNNINHIRLWDIKPKTTEDQDGNDINPFEIKVLPFDGDVTELKFLNSDSFIASSSSGSVYLLKIATSNLEEIDIAEDVKWESIHSFKNGFASSCTSFAIYDSDVATVGEDGRINLLNIRGEQPKRIIDEADSCTINCVEFLKFNEILTSNSRGQMKIWDLRSNENTAASFFMVNNDNIIGATTLAFHPTQRHIIAAGDEQGSITFWDLRHNTFPMNVCSSHTQSVSELHFHTDRPDHIFSCSEAGDVFHWMGVNKQPTVVFQQEPWFTSASDGKFEIFRLMPQLHSPVTSLDLSRNRMLCGADNEAMYFIDEINVYN